MACLLLALPGHALARPRDEVMSGAFRCATIGELRIWLDCFYGAAQPQRAALGMPPAPAAQVRLVASPPAGSVPPGEAAIRDDVMRNAFGCNSLPDERSWLACFYAAAAPARSRLGLASAPQDARPLPPPAPMRPAPEFGLHAPPPPAATADHIAARMTSYEFNQYGNFTVRLDNGQVWQQMSGDDVTARWTLPPGKYAVRISRGVLGSYNFQVRNNPGLFRVQRLQ